MTNSSRQRTWPTRSYQGFVDPPDSMDAEVTDPIQPFSAGPELTGYGLSSQSGPSTASVVDSEPEYQLVVASRRRHHYAMIPVRVLSTGRTSLSDMLVTVQQNLRKIANIIGRPEIEYLVEEETIQDYFVFEVGSDAQLEAVTHAGFLVKDSEDAEPTKVYYQRYTATQQSAQEQRRVVLKAMAWNTKADDVHAAMSLWGAVSSVKMGFNSQKSMARATVLFTSATSVEKMAEEDVTYVIVGRDVACVAQLGSATIPTNTALTMKLTQLPPYFMPIDVIGLFEAVPTPNAVRCCQGITMPVNTHTKQRLPEAFVYFSNVSQWERVRNIRFTHGNYKTAWVVPSTLTCRTCTSAEHRQSECPILLNRKQIRYIRRVNSLAMQSTSAKSKPTTQPKATQSATVAPNAKSTTIPASKAPYKQDNPSSTSNGKSGSYSAAVKGKGKVLVKGTPPLNTPSPQVNTTVNNNGEGPSRTTATTAAVNNELHRRVADLTRQFEADKQQWNAFKGQFDSLFTRVNAVEDKLDRILSVLLAEKNNDIPDEDMSPV
ncbi:hypothetical protein BGX28_001238, partial [Mortierella sp. GBA30]